MTAAGRRVAWIAASVVVVGAAFLVAWLQGREGRERYATLDRRIDSQIPKDRGIQATATFVSDKPAIRVELERLDEADLEKARTRIWTADHEWLVPVSRWTGVGAHDEALEAARAAVFSKLEELLKTLHAKDPALGGEIATPEPKGNEVPHADIMRVLDAFLAAGITDVNFQGAASPLPKRNVPR